MNYNSNRTELERVRKMAKRRGFTLATRPRGAQVQGVGLPRYQLRHPTLGVAWYFRLPEIVEEMQARDDMNKTTGDRIAA